MESNKHLDLIIQRISGIELIAESSLSFLLKEKLSFNRLALILGFFELGKLYLRYKKLKNPENLNKLFISEKNSAVLGLGGKNAPVSKNLVQDHNDSLDSIETTEEARDKMKAMLSNLKKQCFKQHMFNHEYEETLERSNKKINILSSLPIPGEMFQKNTENEKTQRKINYGEWIHIIRPVIYNILLVLYGKDSFTPYILSLFLDLLRIYLQKDIIFYSKIEKQEFDFRKKEMLICYLLRNPFYGNIFKIKVINPILDKIVGKLPLSSLIKMVLLYFIEFRCSLSLLM